MNLLDRLRCAVLGEPCRPPWRPEDDADLQELRRRTEAANREADALRAARLDGRLPTWERLLGTDGDDGREGAR